MLTCWKCGKKATHMCVGKWQAPSSVPFGKQSTTGCYALLCATCEGNPGCGGVRESITCSKCGGQDPGGRDEDGVCRRCRTVLRGQLKVSCPNGHTFTISGVYKDTKALVLSVYTCDVGGCGQKVVEAK